METIKTGNKIIEMIRLTNKETWAKYKICKQNKMVNHFFLKILYLDNFQLLYKLRKELFLW